MELPFPSAYAGPESAVVQMRARIRGDYAQSDPHKGSFVASRLSIDNFDILVS